MHSRKLDEPRFTYGDYVQWQGDQRWELIDGHAYLMSPAPSRRHQAVLFELARQIAAQLEGGTCEVFIAPFDVRLSMGEEQDSEIDTVVQPDISVFCDPTKLDDAGARGAPDWLIEILSPATAARDRVEKRDLYARVGVREYWVVHPLAATLTLFVHEAGGFGVRFDGGVPARTASIALPAVEIDWSRVFRGD